MIDEMPDLPPMMENPPILTGRYLQNEIERAGEDPEFLIENFIYKNSIMMLFADSGVGKSVIALNAMLQACSGEKVFGHLEVQKSAPVIYWILGERSKHEPLSRMKRMGSQFNIMHHNFILDHKMKGLDFLKVEDQTKALEKMAQVYQTIPFDIVVFDPIYAMVTGGLSEDKSATMFTRFSTLVQESFNCSNILIHHTNRGSRDEKTGVRKGADMYGSRWLDAHIDGS